VTLLRWLLLGASLEVIQEKRTEKTEVRIVAREATLREIKERIKKTRRTSW
jgi:large subunit ribosomal protein L24e